jgi:hypothetical protein
MISVRVIKLIDRIDTQPNGHPTSFRRRAFVAPSFQIDETERKAIVPETVSGLLALCWRGLIM